MKKLLEIGNRYCEQADWTDFALVKLCLGAMGLLIGLSIPKKHKECAATTSLAVFGATYAVLLMRFFKVIMGAEKENDDFEE